MAPQTSRAGLPPREHGHLRSEQYSAMLLASHPSPLFPVRFLFGLVALQDPINAFYPAAGVGRGQEEPCPNHGYTLPDRES